MSEVMLFGVLHMPYELAMSNELTRRQFHDRAQEAADLIGRLQADLSDARKSTDFWKAEYLAGNDLIEQQAARIKELEKDAERYRWLRDTDTAVVAWIEEDGPRWSIEGRDGHKITRDKLDAAIDAARRK